ncbi:hypothetical protein AVEN_74565-1 [Araneus ventricosus]|uniref:Uncharacterized protein n=1 Tax=Araneus ventricosus TaxID=182803 RepID=A0A4Y2UXG9_ARAVE|nr:hypothetical protein AVEN_74565-1 [Araneus ventricosus]
MAFHAMNYLATGKMCSTRSARCLSTLGDRFTSSDNYPMFCKDFAHDLCDRKFSYLPSSGGHNIEIFSRKCSNRRCLTCPKLDVDQVRNDDTLIPGCKIDNCIYL